jgi:hypothetical protein
MMGDELQCQLRDRGTSGASAGRQAVDGAPAARERRVARLDRAQHRLGGKSAGPVCAEHGVALKLLHLDRRAQPLGHDTKQVSEDVVGMIELCARKEPRVAAEICDHQRAAHKLRHAPGILDAGVTPTPVLSHGAEGRHARANAAGLSNKGTLDHEPRNSWIGRRERWRSPLSKSGDAEVSTSGRDVLEASVVASRDQGRAPLGCRDEHLQASALGPAKRG